MIVYKLFFRHLVPPTPGGVLPAAKNLLTEAECFSFFLTDEILSKIVDYTNRYITALLQKVVELHGEDHLKKIRSKSPFIKTISLNDLKGFFGLMYHRAIYQWNHMSVYRFWNSNPIFCSTMSLKRFYFMHRYIRFDDYETTVERWP